MPADLSVQRNAIELAWQQAQAHCECRQPQHKHTGGRCRERLEWINRGRHGEGAWEAQRQAKDGGYLILCWDCHAKDN